MKLICKSGMPTNWNLWLFGDTHIGTIVHDRSSFLEFLEIVSQPYDGIPARHNYLVDHGDAIEAIAIDDKRYDARLCTDPRGTPFEQAEEYINLLRPVRKQIVIRLKGNHCHTLIKFGNLAEYISKELGVPYGTYTARITYRDHGGGLIFKHFATHGRKSITSTADDPKRRKANMELILKRHLRHKAGDCLLMSKGHTHRLLVCEPDADLYLTDNGVAIEQRYTHSHRAAGYIHPDHRWYANTGSFYRLYAEDEDSYAERAEYDPLEIGAICCLVRNRMVQEVRRIVLGG